MTNPQICFLSSVESVVFYPTRGKNTSFMPWQLSSYIPNKPSELAPPFYATTDDVDNELVHNASNR